MNYERLIIVGNATKDAEIHSAKQGDTLFATFSLAVNKSRDKANFYSVIIFGPTAEAASQTIKKGDTVLVEGSLNLRPYSTRLKEQRVDLQVHAEQWIKLWIVDFL